MKIINKTNAIPTEKAVPAETPAGPEVASSNPFTDTKELIGTSSIIFTGIYSKEVEVVPGYKVKFKTLGNKDNMRVADLIKVPEHATAAQYLEAAIVPTLTYAIDHISVEDDSGTKTTSYCSADKKEEEKLREDLYHRLESEVPQVFLNVLFSKYLEIVDELREAMKEGIKKKQ